MDKLYLVLDTETTGFKKSGSFIQEGQARVCQLAMILVNEDKKPVAKFSTLIKPDGWTISEGASKVNGLITEMCEKYGMDMYDAFDMYIKLSNASDKIVAHNAAFDKSMMEIEFAYYKRYFQENLELEPKEWLCTMQENIDKCKIPPTPAMQRAGRNHFKSPNLEEALQFFCGRSVGENAHDAMVDAEACLDVFFASGMLRR